MGFFSELKWTGAWVLPDSGPGFCLDCVGSPITRVYMSFAAAIKVVGLTSGVDENIRSSVPLRSPSLEIQKPWRQRDEVKITANLFHFERFAQKLASH